MQIARALRNVFGTALVTGALLAAPSAAHARVFVSIGIAPPEIPIYTQPDIPGDGYIWTPGYWAYGDDGYYWVDGAWVLPPYQGALWTPGYWGYWRRRQLLLERRLLGQQHRLLRWHQLWLRLLRDRLLRRLLERRTLLVQPRLQQLRRLRRTASTTSTTSPWRWRSDFTPAAPASLAAERATQASAARTSAAAATTAASTTPIAPPSITTTVAQDSAASQATPAASTTATAVRRRRQLHWRARQRRPARLRRQHRQ